MWIDPDGVKHHIKDRRKRKRRVNNLFRRIPIGGYFLDYNYEPCVCVSKSGPDWRYDGGIDGKSLVREDMGHYNTSCSVQNCGPEPIKKEEAFRLRGAWNKTKEEKQQVYNDISYRLYKWLPPKPRLFVYNEEWEYVEVKELSEDNLSKILSSIGDTYFPGITYEIPLENMNGIMDLDPISKHLLVR